MYNALWDEAYEHSEPRRAEAILAIAHRLLARVGGEKEIVLAAAALATVPQDKRQELLKEHIDHDLHAEIIAILERDIGNTNAAVVHDALLLASFSKNAWSGSTDELRASLDLFKTDEARKEANHYLRQREHDANGTVPEGAESIKSAASADEAMTPKQEPERAYHWADQAAQRIIAEKGDKPTYTIAAGITPSGVVHIGNFREIITNDLIVKALERLGKKVRFLYSWDDYDTFRKIPKNVPDPDALKAYLFQPTVAVPDPYGCGHANYAEHFKAPVMEDLPLVGIFPEFLHQHEKYRACEYADDIRHALNHRDEIREILNEFKSAAVPDDWWPLAVYCESCNRDRTTKVTGYDGTYAVTYRCECGFTNTFDLRKKGIAKLPWRVDWPMRWHKERVDFEPGGKDHSSAGSSYDTGKVISKRVWDYDAPTYIMYDFISIKGAGGKMSSSLGNTVTLREVLRVYTPELVRFLFAGTRPGTEFAISFDTDVFKIYEDFDAVERLYFDPQAAKSEKEAQNAKRVYELSILAPPAALPVQPSFRHLTNYVQVAEGDLDKVVAMLKREIKSETDEVRVRNRAAAAWQWTQHFAPEQYRFRLATDKPYDAQLSEHERQALKSLGAVLAHQDEPTLMEVFYDVCERHGVSNTAFFRAAYLVLIGKERGPKLANLITQVGHERIARILTQL